MRVIAVLAVRNEERFVGHCLDNLHRQGIDTYVCDNGSTDRTMDVVSERRGRGLVGVEHIPYDGVYRWEAILRRKEALFQALEADWLMHVDADEIHLPPPGFSTLREALESAGRAGYDAVPLSEFTFIPTVEAPDHDHAHFQQTMRWYYHFRPDSPATVRAFRRRPGPMEIAWSGGHHLRTGTPPRLSPLACRMRHYQFLSRSHVVEKYVGRPFDRHEVDVDGWHDWRARLRPEDIRLPHAAALRATVVDEDLDSSDGWTVHWLARCLVAAASNPVGAGTVDASTLT